jgi:WD40 repeat protein
VTTVAVLADGRRALSGAADGRLRLWDLDSGVELRCFEGHAGKVTTVAVLADGRYALSGADDPDHLRPRLLCRIASANIN